MPKSEKTDTISASKPMVVWAILFALIPTSMVFLSIKNGQEFHIFQLFARNYWMPAIIFEIFTLFMALHYDWQPSKQLQSLSNIAKTALSIWIVSIFLSAFFAEISLVSIIYSFLWLLHLCFFGAILHLLSVWKLETPNIRILALIFPLGSAISALLVAAYSFLIGHETSYDWVSDMPGFSNIRHIGYLLLLGSAVSLGAIISGHDKRLHFPLAIINIALIIWFGSRGPFAAIIAAIIIAFVIFPAFRKIDKLFIIASIMGLAALVSQIIPSPPNGSYNIFNRIDVTQSEHRADSEKNVDAISSGRLVMWKDAAQMIAQNPLGHGSDQFKYTAKSAKGASRHPHNAILQIFFEWGLVGGAAFLFLIAMMMRMILNKFIAGKSEAIFLVPTIAACLFALMDGLLFYALPIALLSLLIALQIHKPAHNI